MKNLSAAVRVAILFLLLGIGAYLVWKNLGQNPAGAESTTLFALFRDASGLPKGSKVVVAGLPKGEVTQLEVRGRYAKVTFKLSNDIPVWSSAVVIKKATSLLGENYLEIDPGEPERQLPDGTKQTYTPLGKDCPDIESKDETKRDACRQVRNVIEATTPDQLLHRIEQTLPNVDRVLESVRDLSEDVRRVVNGPLNSVATRVDGLVQREAGTVEKIIERADRTMAKIEGITDDLRSISKDADPRIKALLKNLDEASADAKDLVATAKSELQQTGSSLRGKLDKLDGVIDNTQSITRKIDEDKGTIGRLVNDPTIADNVEEITDGAKDFLGTLFGLKAIVGLRSEYNIGAGLARHYVSVELHTRPDKFYLIELEKGPRGDYPDVSLVFDPTVDPNHWIRKSVIEDHVRFTFQFAKRFNWLTLRYGIKESTGGIGADADLNWWNHDLKLSVDGFDATFDKYPRVKLTAAYELFRHMYILGGIDELLNRPRTLDIVKGTSDVPTQFDTFRFGRDYFLGAMLKFNDEDLAALLTVGGSALGGATK
ncbi:MAG: Mammalian cell entry related domain protein [Myxococcales bacterium]|nr:Mammalian cell entry related domain protein [Myxococcales bacterium]